MLNSMAPISPIAKDLEPSESAGFKQADVQDSAYKYTLKATLSTS